jgi:hypothetical protein
MPEQGRGAGFMLLQGQLAGRMLRVWGPAEPSRRLQPLPGHISMPLHCVWVFSMNAAPSAGHNGAQITFCCSAAPPFADLSVRRGPAAHLPDARYRLGFCASAVCSC